MEIPQSSTARTESVARLAAMLADERARALRAIEDLRRKASMVSRSDVQPAIANDLAELTRELARATRTRGIDDRIRRFVPVWPLRGPDPQSVSDRMEQTAAAARRRLVQRRLRQLEPGLSALSGRATTCGDLVLRLQEMSSRGIGALRIDAGGDIVAAVEAACAALPEASSVIAGRGAIAGLNLRPRSRPAALGVVGNHRAPASDDRPVLLAANRHPDGLPGWRLSGRTWAPWPDDLFSARSRSAVPLLPGSYASRERFYLPAPPSRASELVAAGATMGRRGGFHVDLGEIDLSGPISAFLPFIAHPLYRPLPPVAIPSSSWGASLAALLSRSSWDSIRQSVFERWGNLCQICGQKRGGQGLECHEIWEFRHEDMIDGMRRQRLVGLACLCKACHGAMHLGFSEAMGQGEKAAYRLADINGWSMEEAEIAERCAAMDGAERSRCKWFLDLSLLGRRLLTLDGSRIEERDGTLWHRGGRSGSAGTRIVGASYRIGARGDVRKAA